MYYGYVSCEGKLLFITQKHIDLYNWIMENQNKVSPGCTCHGMRAILEEINSKPWIVFKWKKEDVIEYYYTGIINKHQTLRQQKAYVSYLIKKNKPEDKKTESDKSYIRMFEKYFYFYKGVRKNETEKK